MRFLPSSCFPVPLLLLALVSPAHARDVYGNDTPWTTNDTIIWELHQKQNAFQPVYSGTSWQSQLAARAEQERDKARQAARELIEDRELDAWAKNRVKDVPLTWAQEMERYVMSNGDHAAAEAEQLAFYYVDDGNLPKARRHLERVVFRKGPRAGEAAWQLYRLHAEDGPEPDPAQAAQSLEQSISLGYGEGLWQVAADRYRGKPSLGIAPDPVGALPALEKIFASADRVNGPKAARLLLAYDLNTSGRNDHAIGVLRQILANGYGVRNYDSTHLAELLMQTAGGWRQHHTEIVQLLRVSYTDSDSIDLLARVTLGLYPAALPYEKSDPLYAGGLLGSLVSLHESAGWALAMEVLPPGAGQRLPAAEKLLAALVELRPANLVYGQRYAELLAGNYGGKTNRPAAAALLRKLAADPAAPPDLLVDAARLLAQDFPDQPASPDEAFRLYQRAAALGEPFALYSYADALVHGKGCAPDRETALRLLLEWTRAQQENPAFDPLYTLAAQVIRESNPTDDATLRSAWSRASYSRSYAPAQLESARCLYGLTRVQAADAGNEDYPQKAFALAQRAAQSGLDEARLLLARFYQEGFGTAIDVEAAREIYESGANARVPSAIAALAEIRLDPKSRGHDSAVGFVLAQRAAEAGNAHGQFLLARCFLRGEGTAADEIQANKWFEQSAAGGDAGALVVLAERGLARPAREGGDYAESVARLRTAAEAGSLTASVRLVQAIVADPARPAAKLKQVNVIVGSLAWLTADESLEPDFSVITAAVAQLELLTGQRRDPALSYETARWLQGAANAIGPRLALRYFSRDLFTQAAETGHHGAEFELGLGEIEVGRRYLKNPEDDATGYKRGNMKYSARHFSDGLRYVRLAAAGGFSPATTYLQSRQIPLVDPASEDEIEQGALEKIDPAVRGGRREAEYLMARTAMRKAGEYLADPVADAAVLEVVGHRYSDEYLSSALSFFRAAATAGLPEAIEYLQRRGIALEDESESEKETFEKLKLN